MIKNPFLFGPIVSGDDFYDRVEVERQLSRAVRNGENVLLYGPRRYGKSSLVARVVDSLRQEGRPCLYFDMMKVNSLEHFLQAYASAALALRSRTSRSIGALAKFFKGLRPKITIDEQGEPSLSLDFSSPPTTQTLEDALALPESLGGVRNRVLVVFDEFQEIERLSSSLPLERVFRSVIQRQRNVNYIYLGSKTHLLKRMFTDAARPFYQSALIIEMDKPPRAESIAFLRNRFGQTGIKTDEDSLEAIADASENIPYYLQALAYEVFELADAAGRKAIVADDVATALSKCVRRMSGVFETAVEDLSGNQRTLLAAFACEPASKFDAAYRARHSLPTYTSIMSALKVLESKGLVTSQRKERRIANPFFAAWLREPAYTA
jgi:histone H3/H4